MKRCLWMAGFGLLALCGCGKFFTSQGSGGTGTGGNTGAGDVLYVASATELQGFVVSTTGALTAVSGSPFSLSSPPVSLAVTPANTFLYVGVAAGILGYSIGTNGMLTILNGGSPMAADIFAPASLQVDSTGTTLLAAGIDLNKGANFPEVGAYTIGSDGSLTVASGSPFDVDGSPAASAAPSQLYIAPNNQYAYLTLGTGGTEVLTFTASTVTDIANLGILKNGFSQVGVTANSTSTLLFVTETGNGVRVLSVGANNALTEVKGSPFAAGTGPSGVTLDSTGDYLYVANKGSANISGFSVAPSGTLTSLASSPFAAGSLASYLTLDQSKNFLAVANTGGNPDLGVYSFDATTGGKLNTAGSATGSTPAGAFLIVSTH